MRLIRLRVDHTVALGAMLTNDCNEVLLLAGEHSEDLFTVVDNTWSSKL
jgi:hypothetical protein